MTKRDELLKLADRVEAANSPLNTEVISDLLCGDRAKFACTLHQATYKGSIDAAKGLHDAVLPEWWYVINPEAVRISGIGKPGHKQYKGVSNNPAAAWVAAILRAKAEELK